MEQARIVIIGGGVIGTALAHALTQAGERDVLLLEKSQFTHGCTWHAAGLVGQLRTKRNLTRLMQNSVATFEALEKAGRATGWRQVGSLRLAGSADRWAEIRRSMTLARSFGVECHALDASEVVARFPHVDPAGIVGAAFVPSDGYIDPNSLTHAYVGAARAAGATLREGVTVTGLETDGRRISAVLTDTGRIECEIVVNCAGLWAQPVAEMAGVKLASSVVEHQYFVTEKIPGLDPDLPSLRDPDNNFYLRPDAGSFAIGGWEVGSKVCWQGRPPGDFGRTLFDQNMDRLALFALPAAERLPILNEVGIRTVVNGPIPITSDGEPILGRMPELDNFFVACGFPAGIAASGGVAQALSNWILQGDPGMDLWQFDARRFGPHHANAHSLSARAVVAYSRYYQIHWPGEELDVARNLRLSPLHGILENAGASFGAKFGWERPNWFAGPGGDTGQTPSFEGKPSWFDAVGREVGAVRQKVALIDQTSFAKFEVTGPGAFDALQNLAVANLAGPSGRCIYTQLCNKAGGIEADLTIMALAADKFYVVTGSGFGVRDGGWIAAHLPGDGSARIEDVTNARAVINLCGPRARDVLAAVTDADISNAAFPFLTVRDIEIGSATVRAARIGYVGELGWELHIPVEWAVHVYRALWRAGADHGIANVGYRAIDSLRLEKGYLYWSADISPDYTPLEAGLGFCVDFDAGDFIGRDALARAKERGSTRKLCSFATKGFAPFLGGEAIMHEGKVAGLTTSAGFGHSLGQTIAMGYLPVELAGETGFQIEAFGKLYDAMRGPRTLYDPKRARLNS